MSAKIFFSIVWSKNTFLKQFNVGFTIRKNSEEQQLTRKAGLEYVNMHMQDSSNMQIPVDPRALDAKQHAQVDWSPAWSRLAAVTAQLVARQALHPLQERLSAAPARLVRPLPPVSGLAGRVDAAGGRWSRPVQTLQNKANVQICLHFRNDLK